MLFDVMLPDFSKRHALAEQMEDPSLDSKRLERTLEDLADVNTAVGGYAPSLDGIGRLLDAEGQRRYSILDVGSGSGDVARRIADWAERRGLDVDVTGIDLSTTTVDYARRRSRGYDNIAFEKSNLFELADNRQFDVVHAALMLHHLDGEQAVRGLRKMGALSRRGLVVNDLHRHPVNYVGSKIVLRLLSDNPIIRHDGSVSVLRSFTRRELSDLAYRAGLLDAEIRWWPLFRWQMVVRQNEPR